MIFIKALLFSSILLLLPSCNKSSPDFYLKKISTLEDLIEDRKKIEINRTYFSSPEKWEEEIIYKIFVDRFNNGNLKNDFVNLTDAQQKKGGVDFLPYFRHGGDLEGIVKRLDYLEKLGVTTLLISPVLYNNTGDYHGYCTSDFLNIDPGFGTNEEFKNLVALAHKRGMRVILDIVINHMCDVNTSYTEEVTEGQFNSCTNSWSSFYRKNNENKIVGQIPINFSSNFFPLLKNPEYFFRCGYTEGSYREDSDLSIFSDFAFQMLSFNTLNPELQKVLTEIYKWWISYADIDGVRLDAAKHVTEDFIFYLSAELREHARNLGKDNFFVLAEVASQMDELMLARLREMRGAVDLREIQEEHRINYKNSKYLGVDSLYNFGFSATLRGFWRNKNTSIQLLQRVGLRGRIQHDLVSAIDLHDWRRFASHEDVSLSNYLGALKTKFFFPGIPLIYYGLEQGFNGVCPSFPNGNEDSSFLSKLCSDTAHGNHSRHRQNMFWGPWRLGSLIEEINSLSHIGVFTLEKDELFKSHLFLQTDHHLFKTIQNLIQWRKDCSVFSRGNFRILYADDRNQTLAVSREWQGLEIFIFLNASLENQFIRPLRIRERSTKKWTNMLYPSERGELVELQDKDGNIETYFSSLFTLPSQSVSVFFPSEMLEFNKSGSIYTCKK